MSEFLGIPYKRVGESARMWFRNSEIASAMGVGRRVLLSKMKVSEAGPFRVLTLDISDLRMYAVRQTELDNNGMTEPLFEIDYLLAVSYLLPTESARRIRDWVNGYINRLVYDGFAYLPFEQDARLTRAITAKVCESSNYYEIARDRFNPMDEAFGTNYAPAQVTEDVYLNPDSYILRGEISRVKALSLAIHLLVSNNFVKYEKLLRVLDIDVDKLAGGDEDAVSVKQWLREQHSSAQIRSL